MKATTLKRTRLALALLASVAWPLEVSALSTRYPGTEFGPEASILGAPILPHLANNAAVAGTTRLIGRFRRDGFSTAGDGGAADYTPHAGACPLNNGAGDGGSQLPMVDGCAVIDWASTNDVVNTATFGAVCDAGHANQDTSAFQAAAALGRDVYAPRLGGVCNLLAPVTIAAGHKLRGDGKGDGGTYIYIYSVFGAKNSANAYTQGVITMGGANVEINDLHLNFAQPSDPSSISDMTAYQPAVENGGFPALKMRDVQIDNCSTAIDMTLGNGGNSSFYNVHDGCYVKGWAIDRTTDSIEIDNPHHFPFNTSTAAQRAVFAANSIMVDVGHMEDLKIVGGLSIGTTAIYQHQGADGGTNWVHATGFEFDSFNGVFIDYGSFRGSALTFSVADTMHTAVNCSGGTVVIAASDFFGAAATPLASVSRSCNLTVTGSTLNLGLPPSSTPDAGGSADAPMIIGTGDATATITLVGDHFKRDASTTYQNAVVSSNGSEKLTLLGNRTDPVAGGPNFSIANDGAHRIIGNVAPGASNLVANAAMADSLTASAGGGKYIGN